MRAQKQHRKADRKRRNANTLLSVACALATTLSPFTAFAGQHNGGHPPAPAPHMQAPHSAPPARPQSMPKQQMQPKPAPGTQPHYNEQFNNGNAQQFNNRNVQQFNNRPGQAGHLPEWFNNHQNMTPQQREDALRKEPGFNRLPQDQQQRLVNRMHALNNATPEQRQRILQRNEMFEHLSPEQKAGVRGASQAFHQMPADRQTEMRRAFQDLRGVPPAQRQSILNSARFQQQFSPQERTVLGNLLTVEPYQQRAAGPP
ncbi:DUF3106 domain-containing protein [Alloacidobacterium dinghuense]|uniref:DUF3106 domain-containing protein n=1 Tax=Alloacidobacterium dinghuense TaxID=2763107 RepID=A0A7G8BC55_9BACT|nr:DUF3106 domain-containing protein [Alloacidobacterium dinghuense]QNI30125.1 DUF3106 domain-containing protein [Alloacidobacterium dinghuense]